MPKIIKSRQVSLEDSHTISFYAPAAKPETQDESFAGDTSSSSSQTLEDTQKELVALQIECQNARKTSQQLTDQATIQAQQMIFAAREQAQQLFEDAKREGQAKGRQEAAQSVQEAYRDILAQAADTLASARRYEEETKQRLETEILELVTACTEKITRRLLEQDDEVLFSVVKNALEASNLKQRLVFHVSPEESERFERIKEQVLASFPAVTSIEVRAVQGVAKGDFEIDSEHGTVDPSISRQIQKLHEEFIRLKESSGEER